MSSREQILGRIRTALSEGVAEPVAPPHSTSTIQGQRAYSRPGYQGDRLAQLIERMQAVGTTVERCRAWSAVPATLVECLAHESIEGPVKVAPALDELDWPPDYRFGPAEADTAVGVSNGFAAVAETGSLALLADSRCPASLIFLPPMQVVVLSLDRVVGWLDELWPQLRTQRLDVRAFHLVTGPSRTADIEQTLEIGAHGPCRLHVVLVDA